MNANPYQSPESSVPSEMSPTEAGRRVTGPAIGLIACSTIGLLYCCGFGVWAFLLTNNEMRAGFATHDAYYMMVFTSLGLATTLYAAMLFGAIQMFRRKSYAWAMAASLVALVPYNLFTVPSIGFGIWGLLVLRNKQVKAVFR